MTKHEDIAAYYDTHDTSGEMENGKWVDPKMINDGQARRIAMEWHGGQWTALYSFGSSGAIVDLEALRREITAELVTLPVGIERRELLALDKYVRTAGNRPSMPGWSKLWDNTKTRLEDC
jgi:hypothetical protein